VRRGCARNEAFLVLHGDHANLLRDSLGIARDRIHTVGAGYREDFFHARGRDRCLEPALLFVGKYSAAKGVPWLLDVFERLAAKRPGLVLHVAGGGAGPEADAIRDRMDRMAPAVVQHGQVAQAELAEIARRATVCVLPSFYEGLPLVLVEAFACGCRLVATDLVGVRSELAHRLGDALIMVGMPRLESVDRPRPEDLPAFAGRLESAIKSALDAPPVGDPRETMPEALVDFTWDAVYGRVERVWKGLA
jgi:glycosyltransferase involved in cell wall biosynthesis